MITKSGRTKEIPERMLRETEEYPMQMTRDKLVGLDSNGRIVVDMFDARHSDRKDAYLFGLTLCCNASDKGTEFGVVCRGCHGTTDTGNYIWRDVDGSFPGLDPIESIVEGKSPRSTVKES